MKLLFFIAYILGMSSCSLFRENEILDYPDNPDSYIKTCSSTPDSFYSVVSDGIHEYELYRDGSDGYFYIDESQETIMMDHFVSDTIDHIYGYWINEFNQELCECQWIHDNEGDLNPDEMTGSIDLRGKIDVNLIKDCPKILSSKHNDEYRFVCQYPKINDSDCSQYQWFTEWTYLNNSKSGEKAFNNTSIIYVVPGDCLNVTVTVYCKNIKTGVKSLEKKSELHVKLDNNISSLNKKKI